jgi:hypothetical protein
MRGDGKMNKLQKIIQKNSGLILGVGIALAFYTSGRTIYTSIKNDVESAERKSQLIEKVEQIVDSDKNGIIENNELAVMLSKMGSKNKVYVGGNYNLDTHGGNEIIFQYGRCGASILVPEKIMAQYIHSQNNEGIKTK